MMQAMDQSVPDQQRLPAGRKCDLVIIGGGLAGLSLACWLDQRSRSQNLAMPSVCIIEPRTDYNNDRTWCFWDLEPHPFDSLVSHRWSRWQICHNDRTVTHEGGDRGYVMLSADSVYRKALSTVQANPQLTLHRDTCVERVVTHQDGVLISAGGQEWTAKAVVDTRPPALSELKQEQGLWQLFTGMEVVCPNHGFALETVRLMDFQPGANAIRFMYALPLDQDRLLVEWTEFQPQRREPDFEAELTAWLQDNLKRPYSLGRRESGALPMMEVSTKLVPGRIVSAGVRGGWMRPATGYHFVACQRGAADLASQILAAHQSGEWTLRPPVLHSAALRWMDRVFLRALRRHPQQAPAWFVALFAGTTAAQMSRFMNDQPGLLDMLAIVRALPPGPFIRAALK
jgi:lycopene beta-cyclase